MANWESIKLHGEKCSCDDCWPKQAPSRFTYRPNDGTHGTCINCGESFDAHRRINFNCPK